MRRGPKARREDWRELAASTCRSRRRQRLLLALACGLTQGALAQSTGVPAGGGATAGVISNSPAAVPQASTAVAPPAANGTTNTAPGTVPAQAKVEPTLPALKDDLVEYAGQRVTAIRYVGVDFAKTDKLTAELTQKVGDPFDPAKVRQTTRRLFATGRYRTIDVRVEKDAAGLTLIFGGVPRFYVGRIQIDGVKEDRLTSLLEYGTQLNPGTPFTNALVTAATENVKQVLAQNGFYEPKISVKTTRDDAGQQVNVTYTVATGPQAKIGKVTIEGKDPGISLADFRKKGKLKEQNGHLFFKRDAKVYRDTTSNALSNLRAYFQKKNRLEATVSLQKSTYQATTKKLDYDFQVEQGPIVQVKVDGAKVSKNRLHLLIPVFEEGTVDVDLLNEGTHNLKDYLQQEGYFDATVAVSVSETGPDAKPAPTPEPSENKITPGLDTQTVLYTVNEGKKHKVLSVELQGNKYFTTDLLKENLRVQKADAYLRNGRYSQALVNSDEKSIQSLYRANGYSGAKVTAVVTDSEDMPGGKNVKVAQIHVVFKIVEGTQQMFGPVTLNGVDTAQAAAVNGLLNARAGQPFSLITLSGDRDAMLGYYLSSGFDQAKVELTQTVEKDDPSKTDVAFNVTEGPQVSVGRVLESGIVHVKPQVVAAQVTVHPEDPLDQSALLETQRNLYNLALFNEVVVAVQNPTGAAEQKNVLIQLTEAKRWNVTYGFGFEVQTGVPSCGAYCTQQGTTKAQQGQAGISPRVTLDVGRIALFGTDDSLTLHSTYGLLERVATLTFQNPHLRGSKKFALQLSGGYSNVQDITTFKSSTLQTDVRVTHKATRKDTFIYDFQYRRVSVDPNSLAIASDLIPLLSQPVRVAGPGITWFHDTRDPSPLDAVKGSYTSVSDFSASSKVGSQTDFNRVDITNSTYYQFGKKRKYVLARNTRFGFITSYGINPNIPTSGNTDNSPCGGGLVNTNASCNPVPLPERLYAGGATSHRGFPINGAGPRDLQTGFPVGGSSVLVNTTELRLPAPVLPIVGDSVSFVIFHDMGNVFQHVGDTFKSIGRFHQPNEQTCEVVTSVPRPNLPALPPPTIGTCDFNYFSHAVGIGLRYKTPVGPIRVDFPINLNPPKYPVIPTQTAPGVYVNGVPPYVGQGSHFNFFFSIGQTF